VSPVDAPVVVDALRTPIGTAGRSLAAVDAVGLAAPVLGALVRRAAEAGLDAPSEVVLGNCMGPGGDVARVSSLAAGLEVSVPALTVDRQCASGLAAVVTAATSLRVERGVVLAGGVESASTARWRFWPRGEGEAPVRYERAPFAPSWLGDPDMGVANDLLAEETGVTREAQDAYAARSHARAHAASTAGRFLPELVPVAGLVRDERPRPGMTADRLARLRPAFRPHGTATAGSSCGVSDGAAAVTLVDAATHAGSGLPGLRVLASATAGVPPDRPGRGLVPAARLALDRAGLTLDDLDAVELNEAFAGQVLACCAELGLDPEQVCPDGGALALGHPWGASGAVLVVRLFTRLVREGVGRYGLAAIAAGGGQGVAVVVEAVPGAAA
jgi:acetyl-CoA C-acetyltransferase